MYTIVFGLVVAIVVVLGITLIGGIFSRKAHGSSGAAVWVGCLGGFIVGMVAFFWSEGLIARYGEREVITSSVVSSAQDAADVVNQQYISFINEGGVLKGTASWECAKVFCEDADDVRYEECRYRYWFLKSFKCKTIVIPESEKERVLQVRNTGKGVSA